MAAGERMAALRIRLEELARSQDAAAVLLLLLAFLVCTARFFGILQLDIDVGRDFVAADLLAHGRSLYHGIRYLYGPLAPFLDCLLFQWFGVSLRVLLLAGAAASLCIVLLAYLVARQILSPGLSTAAALIVTVHAIYGDDTMSYATPYTLAATYGLLFALFTLYAALRGLDAPGVSHWDFVAGLSAGLALASKQEFAIIAGVIAAAGVVARFYRKPQRLLAAAAADAVPYALVVALFARLVFANASVAEFLRNAFPERSVILWRRIYGYVGGWGSEPGTRILETIFGLLLNFGFVLWATCLLAVLASLLRGERPAGRRVWILLAAGVLFIPYGSYLGYYPLLLHAVALGLAVAGRLPGPRRRAIFLVFAAVVFLFRVPLYPRSESYALMYFIPSLIVYLAVCRSLIVPYLARFIPEGRVQAALAALFLLAFPVRELIQKERHWAAPSERVWSERGVFRAEPEEASKARVVLEEIHRYTSPRDRILLIPHGAMYYFLSDRQPASSYLGYAYGLVLDGPAETEEIAQWRRTPPKLIIIDDAPQILHFAGSVNTFGRAYNVQLGRWIWANYREVRSIAYSERQVHFLVPNAESAAAALLR
jgi:hypothetical protein